MKEYLLRYNYSFTYYDSDADEEIKDGIPQERYFDDLFEARKHALTLSENCDHIAIYRLVEEYLDEE